MNYKEFLLQEKTEQLNEAIDPMTAWSIMMLFPTAAAALIAVDFAWPDQNNKPLDRFGEFLSRVKNNVKVWNNIRKLAKNPEILKLAKEYKAAGKRNALKSDIAMKARRAAEDVLGDEKWENITATMRKLSRK